MNIENIIAHSVAKNGFVTKGELIEAGLSGYSIKKLRKKKKLIRIGDDKFIPGDIKNYERLGLRLLSENMTDEAIDCLRTCYVVEPQNPTYNLYAIFVDAHNFTFNRMNSYLDVLMNTTDEWRPFYNYCLLLLNRATLLAVSYRNAAKNLTIEDLPQEESKGRQYLQELVMEQRFFDAAREYQANTENKNLSFKTRLFGLLLDRVNRSYKFFITMLAKAIREERFDYAFKLLWSENNKYPLKYTQKILYIILGDIVTMQRTRRASAVIACETDSLENLLECKNYKRAHDLIASSKTVINPKGQNGQMALFLLEYAIKYRESLLNQLSLNIEEPVETTEPEKEPYHIKPVTNNSVAN